MFKILNLIVEKFNICVIIQLLHYKDGENMKAPIAELKTRLQTAMDMNNKKSVDIVNDLGIPKSAISQYLSGKSKDMDSRRLYKICSYLNVSEAWMMGFDVPMERKEVKDPVGLAERHVEMIMDEDFVQLFEDYKKLDDTQKRIVADLVHNLAETKKEA